MPGKVAVQKNIDPKLVEEFRRRLLKEIDQESNQYDPRDVEAIKEDNWYCQKFINHQKNNVDNALEMAKAALKWRKTFGANDIREDNLPKEFFELGATFPYNYDKNGGAILMMRVRLHRKLPEEAEQCRRFIVYWVDRLARENDGGKVSVLFDCSSSGLGNLDMDLIRFIINLFKYYIPNTLSYIIVYDMPWLFSAAWKIIKTWLSKDAVDKIKFTNKTSIKELVDDDQLCVEMGGTDNHEYKFQSETPPAAANA